ncbi:hypothetical protein [Flavobacterium orientale]|uniref:hypothetical protein n=1 Tax=Flavobacterium orientale TaxID=1756020 RepID=UPI001E48E8BE|nr:hypothetical protein [Flavobacterium orientale]
MLLFTFVSLSVFAVDGSGPPPPSPPPPPGSPIDTYLLVLVVIAILFAFYKLNLSKINKKSPL